MMDSDARRLDSDWRTDAVARARCRLEKARARRKELADFCREQAIAISYMEVEDIEPIRRDLAILSDQLTVCLLDINDAAEELRSLGIEE